MAVIASHAALPREIRLRGRGGISASVLDFGATLRSIVLPTAEGPRELLLGHRDLGSYLTDPHFMGATVGRYANRIAGGSYTYAGHVAKLSCNDRGNSLHGGPSGLHRHWWRVDAVAPSSVRLRTVSPAGHEGFPGNLEVTATFDLGEDFLEITYHARTDSPCPVNITAHPYFRLGQDATAMDHHFYIPAGEFLPVDGLGIPLGNPEPVAGTAFDFRQLHRLDPGYLYEEPQLREARGYDHCFVLARPDDFSELSAAAYCPTSGIGMTVSSRKPGIHFYTGNSLSGPFAAHSGFCLEPQYWPDSPNRPSYPSAVLLPGETYLHRIRYWFFIASPDRVSSTLGAIRGAAGLKVR